ncbi:MAG: NADH-quinone oxidoreductase subunit NuoF [Dehalococcoidales bacterium]
MANNKNYTVYICEGTGCVSGKSSEIRKALEQKTAELGLTNIKIDFTGCHGFCEQGPIAIIKPDDIFYTRLKVEDVDEIIQSHFIEDKPVERLLFTDPVSGKHIRYYKDINFYRKQQRIILRNCGRINPEKIEAYIEKEGYLALRKVLSEMTPTEVVEEVKKSGLRGRGGAGFPTGMKWEFCQKEQSDIKYMICNADEGDPGAFMDRSIMEADPHTVIEGMTIAAYATGATEGYIYIRAEYPLAVKRVRLALAQAEEKGFLGENILDSGFSFNIHINEGAGAFVCGEETALMASIEGKRGMPRTRPPFPAQSGLWGKPTTINNVKSLASIPVIINKGADWYSQIGTEKSKGTAVFALTGKISNSGLVEVPMGMTLREIIYDIGGGLIDGKEFKAVQNGGPSGGCLPASALDLPVDYERLAAAGAIMGSGGMIVVDSQTCMVDLAKYFLSFTQAESCGKCVMCREGTLQMLKILEKITEGNGEEGDIDLLLELAKSVQAGSLCALGGTAPNPVLTTIRYFREEYEAHINDKKCPAVVCKNLINFYILPDKCQGCGICKRGCPADAIIGDKRMIYIIEQEKCIKCGNCLDVCPARFDAVVKTSKEEIAVPDTLIPVGSWQNSESEGKS